MFSPNAAACLLTGTKKHGHITAVLALHHWLYVCFRINVKILLIFRVLNGLAPSEPLHKLLEELGGQQI